MLGRNQETFFYKEEFWPWAEEDPTSSWSNNATARICSLPSRLSEFGNVFTKALRLQKLIAKLSNLPTKTNSFFAPIMESSLKQSSVRTFCIKEDKLNWIVLHTTLTKNFDHIVLSQKFQTTSQLERGWNKAFQRNDENRNVQFSTSTTYGWEVESLKVIQWVKIVILAFLFRARYSVHISLKPSLLIWMNITLDIETMFTSNDTRLCITYIELKINNLFWLGSEFFS